MDCLISGSPVDFCLPHSPSSVVNSPHPYSRAPSLISGLMFLLDGPERIEHSFAEPSFSYGVEKNGSIVTHDHLLSELPACISGRQSQSVLADEFPHLDITNYL
ncbi:hypothetical protein HAX54_021479 [Datura stramonium]|uniref:Uncharacterized protein n=1 Tax=Datura stramonium TaxID=4076 RepID=A0ABS8UV87_DATST|nr:hypothetical protein [Datura stramonium]